MLPIYYTNEMKRIEAMRSRSLVVPVPPVQVWIEPTNACNLRCIHCFQSKMKRKRGLMDFSLFKKIVDDASRNKIPVTICGQGEPLLHPEYSKMIKYASERICTQAVTNVTRLNQEKRREILDAEPDSITFSFDAPTKEIYETIRRHADYDLVRQNIVDFIELKRKLKKSKPNITVAIIRQPATEGIIKEFKKWCYSLPIDNFVVNDLINWRGECPLFDLADITDESVKDYLPKSEWPICLDPWTQFTIDWDGSVKLCNLDYDSLCVVGNMRENTIMEIWNGEKFMEVRKLLIDKQYERIEQNGYLCSKCNVMWWPYYNLNQYDRIGGLRFNVAMYLSRAIDRTGIFRAAKRIGVAKLYRRIQLQWFRPS